MPVYRAFVDNDPAPWRKMAEDRATCPVAHFTEDNGFAYHQVCTYELVREVHRRHDVFLNAPGVSPRGPQPEEERVLTFTDPPRHTRQRRLIGKAFSAARMNERSGRIQQVADDLVDAIVAAGSGEFPLKAAFTRQLPAQVIAEILGVPVADRDQFLGWAGVAEETLGEAAPTARQQESDALFLEYSRQQLRKRRGLPGSDLLSAIINSEDEGERFSETEGAAMVRLLLGAGVGTTSIGISNLFWSLESHPEQKRKLLGDLEGLAAPAVEEGLRFYCPVQGNFRGVVTATQIGGTTLEPGERVFMLMSSANHDPKYYQRPDEYIVDRDWKALPRHLAFGFGIHFCVGAELARVESKIAIKTLYGRLPGLRVKSGFVPEQVPGMVLRSWRELQMVYDGPALPRLSAASPVQA